MKRHHKFIGNSITTLLIIVAIAAIYSFWQSSKVPGQLPSIFGYMTITVLTGSMEPKLEAGDLLLVSVGNSEKVKMNDVITYKNGNNTLITHRVVDLVDKNDKVYYQTKGDANNIVDQELVSKEQVIGSLQFHIPKAGYVLSFIKTPIGLLIIVILLLLIASMGAVKNLTSKFREKKDGK